MKPRRLRCFRSFLSVYSCLRCHPVAENMEAMTKRSNISFQTYESCFTSNVWPFGHVTERCVKSRLWKPRKTQKHFLLVTTKNAWRAMFCDLAKHSAFEAIIKCFNNNVWSFGQGFSKKVGFQKLWITFEISSIFPAVLKLCTAEISLSNSEWTGSLILPFSKRFICNW